MLSLDERERYHARSIVSWPRLPILIAAAGVSSLIMGWMLKVAYFNELYYFGIVPALAALPVAGLLFVLVGWAHCRNRWFAGSVGVLAGLVLYLGYYQFCLADQWPRLVWRVDLLPAYIWGRIKTDVVQDAGRPEENKKPDIVGNCILVTGDVFIILGVIAAAGWKRAGRAYCEDLGEWMVHEKALMPRLFADRFREALEAGKLAEYAARTPRGGSAQTSGRLVLEYAGKTDGSAFEYPVYATVEDFAADRSWHGLDRYRRTRVRQIKLEPGEVLDLRPLFPNLSRLLETQHPEVRDLPITADALVADARPVEVLAEIAPVPESFRQRVRGPGYAIAVNLRGLIPLLYLGGGAGLIGAGVYLINLDWLAVGIGLVPFGCAGVCWGLYTALYCLGVYENRWIESRLRREIRQRSDPWIAADDPEALYVSIIPREHFAKVKMTMASDVLLLRLNPPQHELVMEGDSDRYRIPSDAILLCEPQCFFHPIDHQQHNQLWMVRLLINVAEGERELLVSVGNTGWRPMTNQRRRLRAVEVCNRIHAL